MPKDFDRCVRMGGKVRRISGPKKSMGLGPDEYVNICTIGGKSYMGYKHSSKNETMVKKKYYG